jgi:hypothetical protein
MAITNEKSVQVSNADATPIVDNPAYEIQAKLKLMFFKHTQGSAAGDTGSTILLGRIPAGQGYIVKAMSRVGFTAYGAGRVLDIGYAAHTKRDGTAVAAGSDVIADGIDVSAANLAGVALGTGTNAATSQYFKYDSKTPIDIVATLQAGATIPSGTVTEGWIAYTSND